ncbi:Glycosyl hydrolase family protein, partial [Prunus dulcis]
VRVRKMMIIPKGATCAKVQPANTKLETRHVNILTVKEELGSGRVRMVWVSLPVVGMLLVWWWVGFSAVNADYIKYKDANQPVASRVGDLLSRMTLEEKIGQMVQIDRSVANVDTMRTHSIGSVLSGGGSAPLPEASAEDWVNMINEFQKGALASRILNWYEELVLQLLLKPELRDSLCICSMHCGCSLCEAFVGDGGTTRGINENNTVVDRHELLSIHMPAYSDSIIKGVATVMISYSSWNGEKMHANRDLVTGFLKGTLKFKGFVISDWEGVDRITSPPHANYSYSVQASILAGLDMIMIPFKYIEFIDDLISLVKNNVVPMDRIDDAVGRILLVKFTMGLFENPLADLSLVNELGSQRLGKGSSQKITCASEERKKRNKSKSGHTSSKKVSKILVAGSHADNLGYQCGGWTMEWQGFSGNNYTRGTTILSAIKSTVDSSTEIIYRENPDGNFVKSNNFAYAIVVVGEHPYAETSGDSMNLTMAEPGPSVISNVCESVKCIVIIISGRPIVIEPYISSIDALVAAWLPGTEGQGITDVLFGDHGFSGTLPRTWFRTVDQLPMNFGDTHYDPLFPLGFGIETESIKELVTRSTSDGVVGRPCILVLEGF